LDSPDKFPVLLLNDLLLHLKSNIDQPAYFLPNTGPFDLRLEEKYRKVKRRKRELNRLC